MMFPVHYPYQQQNKLALGITLSIKQFIYHTQYNVTGLIFAECMQYGILNKSSVIGVLVSKAAVLCLIEHAWRATVPR